MWVNTWRPHLEGVSLWRYALNFLVVIIAALLWTTLTSPATHAAEATWNTSNGSIRYANLDFQGPQTADGTTPPGVPSGAVYYQNLSNSGGSPKANIVYFEKDADLKNTTNAKYAQYDYDQGATQKYSNPTNQRGISIDKQPADAADKKEQTSCVVGGIGFVVCPVMKFLAEAMDKVYDVLKTFLSVQPLSTNREGGLYKAWAMMLTIANVLFVIGFLIIIYSYLTGQGVKQYDLRTIIPRLIVAAVLINISYYICAAAVDASNIVGANLQDVLNGVRNELSGNQATSQSTQTWANIATLVLSGGTIAAGGMTALALGPAALHLLTPMLVSAGIAVIVAVVVLAARQAIITVLIVIAPIAFAAFILPSTQKYFDKWRGLFMTMLLVYPMFSVLFGGSQLAAMLIAQNATSVITVMLAMFIQVVPLVITPFLIRFSGSLLGKVAGMVNDPTKGVGDRAKNWSKERLDTAKDRRMAQNPGKNFALRGMQRLDKGKRDREAKRKTYQAQRNATYAMQSEQLAIDQKRAEAREAAANLRNDAAFEASKLTNSTAKREAVQHQMAEMSLHNQKARFENYMKELESNKGAEMHARNPNGDDVAATLGNQVHSLAQDHLVQESRKSFAESTHRVEFANSMVDSQALQQAAAGIGGEAAQKLATARATQTIREDFGKGIAAQTELLKHFSDGLDNASLKELALGRAASGKDSQGRTYEFKVNGDIGGELHEAAVAKFLKETNYEGASDILRAASDNREAWRGLHGTIKDAVIATHASKAPFLSGQALDRIDQGHATSAGGYERMIIDYINKGKFSRQALATADSVALEDMLGLMQAYHDGTIPAGAGSFDRRLLGAQIENLIEAASATLSDPQIGATISSVNAERLGAIKNFNSIR